jgi:hypothetical protein
MCNPGVIERSHGHQTLLLEYTLCYTFLGLLRRRLELEGHRDGPVVISSLDVQFRLESSCSISFSSSSSLFRVLCGNHGRGRREPPAVTAATAVTAAAAVTAALAANSDVPGGVTRRTGFCAPAAHV